ESVALVERARPIHLLQRLEIHALELGSTGALEAHREELLPDAEPADLRVEVHLAELARRAAGALERREAAATDDDVALLAALRLARYDEVTGACPAIRGEHVVDLG